METEQEVDLKISNLTDIPGRISEDQAVQWLKSRLLSGNCYSWAGAALLAVNAGQENILDFSESAKKRFRDNIENTDPHPFAVAARAQHRLTHEMGRKNQAIVISGDSGSGKTFSASHLLNLLITCGSSDSQKAPRSLSKIWTSVPILMAFGNAHTECNANSSRFGKLIQLQYRFGTIRGAYLKTFLLEKTRVATQGKSQRNFHVFYQLLAGLQDEELASLHLSKNAKYNIIPGGIRKGDNRGYDETTNAMINLGMKPEELYDIHVVLAAIIHLGNISFCQQNDSSAVTINQNIESKDSFAAACKLLGLSEMVLSTLLTTSMLAPHSTSRRCTIYQVPILTVESCQARRDCLMRLLYEKLFHWLVAFINKQIQIDSGSSCTELGILDIYGFENFKQNSLEQLCINYANERLQNYFIENFIEHTKMTLKLEMEEDTNFASSDSFEQALNVFHAPSRSLFAILNEESMLSRHTSDIKVWDKIYTNLAEYSTIVPTKYNPDTPQFSVQHYAGKVCYDVKDICEKNLDKVPTELPGYIKLSTNTFVVRLIDEESERCSKHSTKKTTVINKYQSSLDTLLSTLDGADIHFIRCVKATVNLEPGAVDTPYFKQQLVASGIADLIPLNCHRFRHFPYWFKTTDFMQRYQTLLRTVPVDGADFVQMMKDNKEMRDHIKVGRLSVFVSEAGISKLEEWKQNARRDAVLTIQRAWRNYTVKKNLAAASERNKASQNARRDAVLTIQRAWRNYTVKKNLAAASERNKASQKARRDAVLTIQRAWRNYTVKKNLAAASEGNKVPLQDERCLPEVCNNKVTRISSPIKKCFKSGASRTIFIGNCILSRLRLAKVPIRFHTRKTCISYSHCLPASELPQGLEDALEVNFLKDI